MTFLHIAVKGKEAHTEIDKRSRKTHTINQMYSTFTNSRSFSYPIRKQQQHLFLPTFFLNYKTKQGVEGAAVIHIDNTARDHIHTDKTTCNIEELQQKYLFGMVSNRFLEV